MAKKDEEKVCARTIKELFKKYPISDEMKPHEIVDFYYTKYQTEMTSNNSINGKIFENLLLIVFLREGITPIYYQAKMALVPNVDFDMVFYNRKTPVAVSAKTSLRERWKQADIESMALKYVHRKAQCYLLTLSKKEVEVRRKEENSYVGIDEFVLANEPEFDEWLERIKAIPFRESETIDLIENADVARRDESILNELLG